MPLRVTNSTDKEGRWFTYSGDIEFLVRPLTASVMRDIEKQSQTGRNVLDPKTKKWIPEVDDAKKDDLLTDYLVQDWRCVVDENDAALPVNLENKKKVLNLLPVFDFVWQCGTSLDILPELQKNL